MEIKATKLLTVIGLSLAGVIGFLVIMSLPDIQRYIKISTM